jgi:hypothetical protein
MEFVLYAADTVYTLLFAVAAVVGTLQSQRDIQAARTLVIIGAIIVAVRWSAWAVTTDVIWSVRGGVGAIIGATLFILIPAALHWLSERQQETSPVPPVVTPSQNREPPRTERQVPLRPSQKYIIQGLTKARDDLLSIKKEDLSCDALNAWQLGASDATRLAHANGIGIHNPISQYLSACQNITDIGLLDAIRMSVVQLLDQGIQSAGG